MGLRPRQYVEGKRQQAVAGEDGGRFVESLVRGRAAAPQVVVVHRREVVVRERIAVHAFDRASDHQRLRTRHAEQAGRLHRQKGAKALAAAERSVAHGREEAGRSRALAARRFGREQAIEQTLHIACHAFELLLKRRVGRSDRVSLFRHAQQVSPLH